MLSFSIFDFNSASFYESDFIFPIAFAFFVSSFGFRWQSANEVDILRQKLDFPARQVRIQRAFRFSLSIKSDQSADSRLLLFLLCLDSLDKNSSLRRIRV